MENITELLSQLPEEAKDIRINLKRVLSGEESLDLDQTWGCAIASAYFIRNAEITEAVLADAKAAGISDAIFSDAKAAAIIMGQNTIYYRFRHLMNKDSYNQRPANLRMMRMQQVASTKLLFELFSIGPAALKGCEMCLKAHEDHVIKGGLGEDQVHDVVRISAALFATAVALDSVI
jgi:alkyl hydroperoxide reductase subunit D